MSDDGNSEAPTPGTGLNRPKQFEASREEFLAAALALFAKKGFHDASVDDIVAKAGRSKGGFYHHFQSKDQLYIEVFDQILGNSLRELKDGMQSGESVRMIFEKLIVRFEPMMANTEQLRANTDFLMHSIRNPEAAKILQLVHKTLIKSMTEVFTHAMDRGEWLRTFEPELIASIMLSAGRGIVITCLMCDEPAKIPEQLRAYVRITLQALENRQD